MRHAREHQLPPHRAQLGQFSPARLQPPHTAGTRRRDARSSASSVGACVDTGGSVPVALLGVAGPADEDAVLSEETEGEGLGVRRERGRVSREDEGDEDGDEDGDGEVRA